MKNFVKNYTGEILTTIMAIGALGWIYHTIKAIFDSGIRFWLRMPIEMLLIVWLMIVCGVILRIFMNMVCSKIKEWRFGKEED